LALSHAGTTHETGDVEASRNIETKEDSCKARGMRPFVVHRAAVGAVVEDLRHGHWISGLPAFEETNCDHYTAIDQILGRVGVN
jgi:hypothetical protein